MAKVASSACVVGGGFFGCMTALHLSRFVEKVTLLEAGQSLMTRASLINQARIHQGYHYPRSLTTGLSSRIRYQQFIQKFSSAVADEFDAYYAISREQSKVTAPDFEEFCRRIEAPLRPVGDSVANLFDPNMVEGVYQVKEHAFDGEKLRKLVLADLNKQGVTVQYGQQVDFIEPQGDKYLLSTGQKADHIYLCTYGNLNHTLTTSGLKPLPLRFELTEMALLEPSQQLRQKAITVMDGPFFSFFPYPSLGLNTLSHVTYTPHFHWQKETFPHYFSDLSQLSSSNHKAMLADASRWLPDIRQCHYRKSIWEVKTTLNASENNDSRPIGYYEVEKGIWAVLGSKIDNIFDLELAISASFEPNELAQEI